MSEPGVGSGLDIQISRLAVQLAEDDLREVGQLFATARETQPQLIWNPQPHQLPTPNMRTLMAAWDDAGGRRRAALGPPPLDGALATIREDLLCLVADLKGGLVYTHVGRETGPLLGQELLGRTLAAAVKSTGSADRVLYAAGYLACRIREVPLLTFNESRDGPDRAISRLVVPYWVREGGVGSFVTAISVIDRAATV